MHLVAAPVIDDNNSVLAASLPGLVIREDGDRLRFVSRLVPDELAASFADLSLDDPRPIVEAVRTGRRIVLPDRAAFRRRYPGLVDRAAEHGIVCTAALPLNDSRGEPIAARGLGWRVAGFRPFSALIAGHTKVIVRRQSRQNPADDVNVRVSKRATLRRRELEAPRPGP